MRRRVTAKVERADGTVFRARSGRGLTFGVDRLAVAGERWAPTPEETDDGETFEFCEIHSDDLATCRAFETRKS